MAKNKFYVTASLWVEAVDEGEAELFVEDALLKSKHVTEIDIVEAESEDDMGEEDEDKEED